MLRRYKFLILSNSIAFIIGNNNKIKYNKKKRKERKLSLEAVLWWMGCDASQLRDSNCTLPSPPLQTLVFALCRGKSHLSKLGLCEPLIFLPLLLPIAFLSNPNQGSTPTLSSFFFIPRTTDQRFPLSNADRMAFWRLGICRQRKG